MKRTIERTENPRKFIKWMKEEGWELDRHCAGSHLVFTKNGHSITVKNTSFNVMIQRRIRKEMEKYERET